MNQVLSYQVDLAYAMGRRSFESATLPLTEKARALKTALDTLQRLATTPNRDELHDLKLRTAIRVVMVNLLD